MMYDALLYNALSITKLALGKARLQTNKAHHCYITNPYVAVEIDVWPFLCKKMRADLISFHFIKKHGFSRATEASDIQLSNTFTEP
jgi:hypothetical protein